MPIKSVVEAILEAQDQLLAESKDVYLIGEGINDQGAFGTTKGLKDKYPGRVHEMPVSENGMTGVCIGTAISGMRPIMVHMRADFLLYAMDQIVNVAASWRTMFGGKGGTCPLVIRAVIGRGWGQGINHSQHFERIFDQLPGLKVICPSNAYDAKGMLIWASRQEDPVMIFEHRWVHGLKTEVPDEMYEVPPTPHIVANTGDGKIIKTYGYLVHEAIKASKKTPLTVWDMRGPRDSNWYEKSHCPPSPHLSYGFYPEAHDLCSEIPRNEPNDIPNKEFVGPF